MTGSLLLTGMGLAQVLWGVPIPRWSYVAVTGSFLTWAFFKAWVREHNGRTDEHRKLEEAQRKLSELDEQLTDKGPQLTIERWANHQNPVHPNDAIQYGFYIRNFGETAYTVKVESFTITTPYGASQKVSSVEASSIANDNEGFVPVFIENSSPVFRWHLEELLLESYNRTHTQHVIPISITYADARGRHYRASWELIYVPIRRELKFKFLSRVRII